MAIVEDALPGADFEISNSDGSIRQPCNGALVNGDVLSADELSFNYTWSTGANGVNVTDVSADELTLTVEDIATTCTTSLTKAISRFTATPMSITGFDFCELTSSLVSIDYVAGQDVNTFTNRVWVDENGDEITELNDGQLEIIETTKGISLTALDANGCQVQSSNSLDILEIDNPVVSLTSYLTTGEEYKGYTIEASVDADSTVWEIIQGSNVNLIYNTLILNDQFPLDSTDFSFAAFNYGRGVTCTNADIIRDLILDPTIEIPNVITPNGDDVNDFFWVKNAVFSKAITIQIFNQWGNVIFETNSKARADGWNGLNQSDKDVSEGAYFYLIEVTSFNNKVENYNGSVQVIK